MTTWVLHPYRRMMTGSMRAACIRCCGGLPNSAYLSPGVIVGNTGTKNVARIERMSFLDSRSLCESCLLDIRYCS